MLVRMRSRMMTTCVRPTTHTPGAEYQKGHSEKSKGGFDRLTPHFEKRIRSKKFPSLHNVKQYQGLFLRYVLLEVGPHHALFDRAEATRVTLEA